MAWLVLRVTLRRRLRLSAARLETPSWARNFPRVPRALPLTIGVGRSLFERSEWTDAGGEGQGGPCSELEVERANPAQSPTNSSEDPKN